MKSGIRGNIINFFLVVIILTSGVIGVRLAVNRQLQSPENQTLLTAIKQERFRAESIAIKGSVLIYNSITITCTNEVPIIVSYKGLVLSWEWTNNGDKFGDWINIYSTSLVTRPDLRQGKILHKE